MILVDGGRGQLAMAVEALRELGVEGVKLASLAKDRVERDPTGKDIVHSEERVFRPGRSNPIVLSRSSSALFLLQQLRDEAHRFAITSHRKQRTRTGLASRLDTIPGIGPARRKALILHFGSIQSIMEADVDELVKVPGITETLANSIKSHLD